LRCRVRRRRLLCRHASQQRACSLGLTQPRGALQGLTKLDLSKFFFGAFAMVDLAGIPCFVTRTGYTGEDGFEISVPNERAVELTEKLLGTGSVHLAGAHSVLAAALRLPVRCVRVL